MGWEVGKIVPGRWSLENCLAAAPMIFKMRWYKDSRMPWLITFNCFWTDGLITAAAQAVTAALGPWPFCPLQSQYSLELLPISRSASVIANLELIHLLKSSRDSLCNTIPYAVLSALLDHPNPFCKCSVFVITSGKYSFFVSWFAYKTSVIQPNGSV